MSATPLLRDYLDAMPLMAILRGLPPQDAGAVGEALVSAGFAMMEVPLNGPDAVQSIYELQAQVGDRAIVGAGTVLQPEDVNPVDDAGGRFIVSPNVNDLVIEATLSAEMISIPGACTPTEIMKAITAGAHAIKLFPAEAIPPAVVRSLRTIVPDHIALLPVGGIRGTNMAEYVAAGAAGFGIGSSIYRPGHSPDQVHAAALLFVDAWRSIGGARRSSLPPL